MNLKELWQDKDAVFTICLIAVLDLGWLSYKLMNDVKVSIYIELPITFVLAYIISFNVYKQLRLQRLRE